MVIHSQVFLTDSGWQRSLPASWARESSSNDVEETRHGNEFERIQALKYVNMHPNRTWA
jgi:hypothetical protein